MIKYQAKKNKLTQYVIGGGVAVVILGFWISLPLMTGSSLDSSVSAGNPFKSRVADIALLGSDISPEGGAPGSPLSGAMIDNPATSGDDTASSLFQSGLVEEEPSEVSAPAGAAAAPPPAASASAGAPGRAPGPSGQRGKLSAAASLGAGNSNSMTAGSVHDKFFGSGNKKAELIPASSADIRKADPSDKGSSLLAMLSNSADKSKLAAKSGNLDAAKTGAVSAFVNTGKASSSDLKGSAESKAAASGLQMGQAAQDLKKNDPNLNNSKITPPSPPEAVVDEDEQMKKQLKMMFLQMLMRMAMGVVFGGIA